MGHRSGVPDTIEEIAKLSRGALAAEIARCERGFDGASNARMRRVWLHSLLFLDRCNEALYGEPAPRRSARARKD